MTDSSNYCSLPFKGMQIECDGEIKPCCLYKPNLNSNIVQYHITNYDQWQNESLPQIQRHVINNTVDPGCDHCLNSTSLPHPLRTTSNKFFKNQPRYQSSTTPEWLDIRLGNFCNLKCMMCTPWNSSQIEQEYDSNIESYNKLGISYPIMGQKFHNVNRNWWDNADTFNKVIDILNRARYVNFSGGEPLIMPQLYKLMDALDAKCVVTFNTNLTKLSDRAVDYLKKFKLVILQVSLDGIADHQEWIRWNSRWSDIDRNINTVCNIKNITVNFSYLLQHTTVYTWPKLWQYLQPLNKKVVLLPVYKNTIGQGMLTQNSVSLEDMQKFKTWVEHNPGSHDQTLQQWISNYEFDPKLHQEFQDYVNMLDRIRGGNFAGTFDPSW
jgi:molybdenum cofactor biosynthesis enzyme MoaA